MLHPDASTVRLIHRHMIEEEMRRHRRPNRDGADRPGPRRQPVMAVRHATARALHAVARWIEPPPVVDAARTRTKPVL